MDGTYGNIFPTNNTNPLSPGAPSPNNKYQINVNRSKTRKWANFKPQNYDGDDWGSEEYDDVDEEPPSASRQPAKQYKPYTPALHLQTQQPPAAPSGRIAQMVAASSTPATPTALERTGTFGQPQYDAPRATSPVVGGKQVLPSMMRVATMPQNVGPGAAPTQFPPRKSSMGAREIPDMTDPTRQPRSTTWAVPTQRPWSDARSASPNARSPVSPNKPLPVPQSTDIYRRLAADNNAGPQPSGFVNQGQLANGTQTAGLNSGLGHQERRGSATGNEGGENTWGGRPSLAPVMERNSEYGVEGLLAGTASKESGAEPVTFEEEEDKVRRFSTSPKLPDLTRLSGFGEDLFSTRFSVLAPQLASIPDISTPSSPAKAPEPEGISTDERAEKGGNSEHGIVTPANPSVAPTSLPVAEPVSTAQAPPPSIGGAAVSDATPQFAQEPIRSESPPNQSVGLLYTQDDANESHAVANAPQQLPYTMETPPETISSDMDKQAVRPRLPGGWVTETLSTPGETPPPARNDTFSNMTSNFPQPPSASLVAKSHADAERSSSFDQSQQHDLYGTSETNEAAIESSHSTSDGEAAQATPTSDKDTHASLAPIMEPSERRDITPTAPLNFNRGLLGSKSAEPLHVLPSPNIGGSSNLNTPGDSPLKESDLLRDEITKFLGGPEISGSFLDIARSSSTPNHPVADATRESSYFGDVYGDYFAASEDNQSQTKPGVTTQPAATDTPTPVAAGTSKGVVVAPLSVATSTSSGSGAATSMSKQDSTGETSGAFELRRRFSWEGPSEQDASDAPEVDTAYHAEHKSRRSGPDGVSFASSTPAAEKNGETMALTLSNADEPSSTSTETANKPVQAASGGISHDVSEVSTLPSRSMLEPASPVSASSDEDAESRRRALSAGHDKILVQPSEQHPAFGEKPSSRSASAGPKDPVNIISFRQIMEMPSSADRLGHYNEIRLQFAAIDTGLEEWLLAMRSKHPEHSNAMSSFKDSLTMPVTPLDAQQSGEAMAPSPGYFQQGGRPGTNMPMPPSLPHGHSGFAHSSQQVGTKGKELLFAAGKAGKGLLSKGKNKLKGTGDKVFF
ncbi:hypothetical protein QBC32DRAFT_222871 [Pseudoneurospora amorphoporcata]|uniref:Uncharacterized protein n=1 Tax=Pseudoneurospora amorphoporcata TaxID=241081 RepID=A0AAN6SCF1_9PEZI|nr:hypothetical protein QBC32DRAFT_222871 [Pseudoneurospora amorphoporcata]